MNLFWLEFFYFIVAAFAILVSISAAALFILTFRFEERLRTVWRAVGFSALALAFFLLILERKYPQVGLAALFVELIAFFSIFRGVLAEPILSHLGKDPEKFGKKKVVAKKLDKESLEGFSRSISKWAKNFFSKKNLRKIIQDALSQFVLPNYKKGIASGFKKTAIDQETLVVSQQNFFSSVALLAFLIISIIIYIFFRSAIYSTMVVGAIICIAATIPIQLKRLNKEKKDAKNRKQNFYPLLGYIFLLASMAVLFFYRLPDSKNVFLRQLKMDYSLAWQLALLLTFLGFLFLAIWAWNFIKLRVFLRTYVAFLTSAIIVSSLGALVFTVLIFGVVEKNNLDLMERGARSQSLIMQERFDTALTTAKMIAEDTQMIDGIEKNSEKIISERINQYAKNSKVDTMRVFNASKEIIYSLEDSREKGRIFNQDALLDYVLTEKKHIKSFSAEEAVLAYIMNARSIAPVLVGDKVIGAVEVAYKFDNAFVDYSKEKTGLDVTIYTGARRSATTIQTLDGVSRWVGSEETDRGVIQNVLERGNSYNASLDRLGRLYYSAFEPLRDVNGVIIGMVAVGVPTNILFENTRMQLVNAFLIMTVISLLVVAATYLLIRRYQRGS